MDTHPYHIPRFGDESGTMTAPTPATMPDPTSIAPEVAEVLHAAALTIATFRRRLRESGFPFREPDETVRTISRIDALCFPEEKRNRKSGKGARARTAK